MGTIVCQGLQSCLESQMLHSTTLRLRLSAPRPPFSTHSLELSLKPSTSDDDHKLPTPEWSFIQSLSNPTTSPSPYTSVTSLTHKSLQLCTENLGSETGTDNVSATDDDCNYLFSPLPSSEVPQSEPNSPTPTPARSDKRSRRSTAWRGSGDFPPPLTTMRGPELFQVRRPQREGGRLVIKAVKSQSQPSCFEVERIDGRLRIHVAVVKDSSSVTASEKIAEEEEILIREGEEGEEITEKKRNNNRNSNLQHHRVEMQRGRQQQQ